MAGYWLTKDLLYKKKIIFLPDTAILPARVANHDAGFGLSSLLTKLMAHNQVDIVFFK